MNYLRRITLTIVLIILIGLVVSMFLPSSFHLERKIIINADKEQIFKQVNDLKNWKNWSPWVLKDSLIFNKKYAFSIPSSGVGAKFNWDSENEELGLGRIEIFQSKPNDSIVNLVTINSNQYKRTWFFNELENGVVVIWAMDIDFGFSPIDKFYGLFIEDEVSQEYELGLQRLKSYTENLPKIQQVEVKKMKIEKDQWFLSIRDTISPTSMNNIHGKIYAEINQFMNQKDIESAATPLVIYHFWSDTIVDIECGIPIKDSITIDNNKIKLNKIKLGNVVTAIHYGSYDRLPETYFGINEWMRKNKVVVTGSPWESYITDPTTESNPEKWQTAIFFPIE